LPCHSCCCLATGCDRAGGVMVYKPNWSRIRRGPKFSGQSKAYLAGSIGSRYRGYSAKTAHKIGLSAALGYNAARAGARYGTRWNPFNQLPRPSEEQMQSMRWSSVKRDLASFRKSRRSKSKSKRGLGSARKRTGRPKSRKTMRARSAHRRPGRSPARLRYRKGGCPPGYRYDPRSKMCIHKSYR